MPLFSTILLSAAAVFFFLSGERIWATIKHVGCGGWLEGGVAVAEEEEEVKEVRR